MSEVMIIGVGGGSCSGKTTLVKKTAEALGADRCTVLTQDNYYHDQSHLFDQDGGAVNFDHPNAIDFELMARQLAALKANISIEIPVYDFVTHSRLSDVIHAEPKPVIFIEGILVLCQFHVYRQFDFSLYIECDEQTRLERRITRDVNERGRTKEGVIAQFRNQVAPMHERFVEPSRKNAGMIMNKEAYQEEIAGQSRRLLDICRELMGVQCQEPLMKSEIP